MVESNLTIKEYRKLGIWDMLNERMQKYLKYTQGSKKDSPFIWGKRYIPTTNCISTAAYVSGIMDFHPGILIGDTFLDDLLKETAPRDLDKIEKGDLVAVVNLPEDNEPLWGDWIYHAAVYIGDFQNTHLLFHQEQLGGLVTVASIDQLKVARDQELRRYSQEDIPNLEKLRKQLSERSQSAQLKLKELYDSFMKETKKWRRVAQYEQALRIAESLNDTEMINYSKKQLFDYYKGCEKEKGDLKRLSTFASRFSGF